MYFVAECSTLNIASQMGALSAEQLTLTTLMSCIKPGDWSKCESAYQAVKNELSTTGIMVFRGTRIVIPLGGTTQDADASTRRTSGNSQNKIEPENKNVAALYRLRSSTHASLTALPNSRLQSKEGNSHLKHGRNQQLTCVEHSPQDTYSS